MLTSDISKIAIASTVFAWWTGFIQEVNLEVIFADLISTDTGFLESIEFTGLANDLPPIPGTFITLVKSSATDELD